MHLFSLLGIPLALVIFLGSLVCDPPPFFRVLKPVSYRAAPVQNPVYLEDLPLLFPRLSDISFLETALLLSLRLLCTLWMNTPSVGIPGRPYLLCPLVQGKPSLVALPGLETLAHSRR